MTSQGQTRTRALVGSNARGVVADTSMSFTHAIATRRSCECGSAAIAGEGSRLTSRYLVDGCPVAPRVHICTNSYEHGLLDVKKADSRRLEGLCNLWQTVLRVHQYCARWPTTWKPQSAITPKAPRKHRAIRAVWSSTRCQTRSRRIGIWKVKRQFDGRGSASA